MSLYTLYRAPWYQSNGGLEAAVLGTRLSFEAKGDPSSKESFVLRTPGAAGGCRAAAEPQSIAEGPAGTGRERGRGGKGKGALTGQLQGDHTPPG